MARDQPRSNGRLRYTRRTAQLALFALGADVFVLRGKHLQLFVAELLDVNHLVLRLLRGTDQFVELEVQGARVSVLRVLDDEHHQERDDRGGGVDDELPCVRVVIARPEQSPRQYGRGGKQEGPRRTGGAGGGACEVHEGL